MRISLVITVLNEALTIETLIEAIAQQTLLPSEIIIADGGSTDGTVALLHKLERKYPQLHLKTLQQPGNRSVGRNTAIAQAQSEVIAITDAGCVPHQDWLAELVKTYTVSKASVVAGYYQGEPRSAFEEAVIPYALVMPDQVQPANFLPATRSMLIEKKVWHALGGFDESLAHNEDYAFARKLARAGVRIAFSSTAIVSWRPRENWQQFWRMIYRFAVGDGESASWRPKVWAVYLRYLVWFGMGGWLWAQTLPTKVSGYSGLGCLAVGYVLWAIKKNLKYVPHGWYYLPWIQVLADSAVMIGTLVGVGKLMAKQLKTKLSVH